MERRYIHVRKYKNTTKYKIYYKGDNYGTYNTLEKAQEVRDKLINSNWTYDYTKDLHYKIHHTYEKYITQKKAGNITYYTITKKTSKNKIQYYGMYYSYKEAKTKLNQLIQDKWKKQKTITITPTTYIYKIHNKTKEPTYVVQKKINGLTQHFGTFSTLKEAQHERNLLIKYDWDYDLLCEAHDDRVNGKTFFNNQYCYTKEKEE